MEDTANLRSQVWNEYASNGESMTIYRRHWPIKDKLLERIVKSNTGCWLWQAAKDICGYGRIWYNNRNSSAHSVSYLEFKGPIPKGNQVLHTCDTPSCINPDHLWLGTHRDNMEDKAKKKRYPKKDKKTGRFMEKA